VTPPHLPTIADVRAAAEHCSYNAKLCRFACPVATATGKESVTPWGINRAIAAAAQAGAVNGATAAAVYGCTGCRACGGVCLPGLDLPTHVRAARAEVVAAGLAPPGVDAAAGRARTPAEELVAGATRGAGTVVYPGCRSADGAAVAALLAAVDEPYDVVREPTCCGARSIDVGLAERGLGEAAQLAGHLAGADRVVVADPHCARLLRTDHADDRVVALPVFLADLLDRLGPCLRPTATGRRVAWHDPCWLGRGMAAYQEPRALLVATGAEVVEPAHTREHARCTGGGMGYAEVDPPAAGAILAARAADLRCALDGAATVVTACPTAADRLRRAGLDAHDLSGWLAGLLPAGRL